MGETPRPPKATSPLGLLRVRLQLTGRWGGGADAYISNDSLGDGWSGFGIERLCFDPVKDLRLGP